MKQKLMLSQQFQPSLAKFCSGTNGSLPSGVCFQLSKLKSRPCEPFSVTANFTGHFQQLPLSDCPSGFWLCRVSSCQSQDALSTEAGSRGRVPPRHPAQVWIGDSKLSKLLPDSSFFQFSALATFTINKSCSCCHCTVLATPFSLQKSKLAQNFFKREVFC